jgi:putative membrane protein
MTFKQAWLRGPGPTTLPQALLLAAKGFCMGVADIIPGVSGGTIAFITGIYEDLLAAIRSVNAPFVAALARLRPAEALGEVHLRFLLPLLLGLGAALVGTAGLMHHLLTAHPVQVWALFLGLIGASILVVGRMVPRWGAAPLGALVLGAVAAWVIVGLIPVATPETPWFLFLCGVIAICAMILPGISGSFLLLILGKYEYVTAALRNPLDPGNLLILLIFGCGCVVGIAGFSRLLSWLLTRWHAPMIALLTGFMIGAARKVWPWKETLETAVIRGKVHVLREAAVLPDALDAGVLLALGLMAAGFAAVLLLDRLASGGAGARRK